MASIIAKKCFLFLKNDDLLWPMHHLVLLVSGRKEIFINCWASIHTAVKHYGIYNTIV